jgi:hypothetical protein
MAQTGYTPIILFNSTTASNVPTTSNLAVGELAINIPDGKLYYNKSGTITVLANANFATSVTTISFGTTGLTPSTATNGVVTVAGTLAVANGGTGQTTKSAAFNALSPITTTGDLIIGNGTNSATNLPIGTNGYVLTSNGTTATWAASGGGSQATATALGTVYALQTTSGASPYLTAFGYNAGVSNNSSGVRNTAIGAYAMQANTSGTYNVAVGMNALYSNVTGSSNTAIGQTTLFNNTVDNNTAIGYAVLLSNTTGTYNTAIGSSALQSNTTGAQNVAVGYQALYSNTTASLNTAVGYQALTSTTYGDTNTCFGYLAGASITSGNANLCIGVEAGAYATQLTTGNNNVLIGYGPDASASGSSQQIVLCSYPSTGKGNSTGFINPNSGGVYQGNNSAAWSVTSDQRLKKNIVDNNVGLEKIAQIQVRNFEYRTEDEITDLPKHSAITKQGVQLGVIAQELQQILPDCVKEESTGVLALETDNIMWHLINAIKELNAEIQTLKAKVGV